MKQIQKPICFSFFMILALFFISCDSADSGTVEAYVGISCGGNLNHTGDDVYAYDASEFFFTQSIQAGGHTDGGTTDIGVNIFNGNSLVEEGE